MTASHFFSSWSTKLLKIVKLWKSHWCILFLLLLHILSQCALPVMSSMSLLGAIVHVDVFHCLSHWTVPERSRNLKDLSGHQPLCFGPHFGGDPLSFSCFCSNADAASCALDKIGRLTSSHHVVSLEWLQPRWKLAKYAKWNPWGLWNLRCQRQSQCNHMPKRWRSKQSEVALALNFLDLAGMQLWQWASASEDEIRWFEQNP